MKKKRRSPSKTALRRRTLFGFLVGVIAALSVAVLVLAVDGGGAFRPSASLEGGGQPVSGRFSGRSADAPNPAAANDAPNPSAVLPQTPTDTRATAVERPEPAPRSSGSVASAATAVSKPVRKPLQSDIKRKTILQSAAKKRLFLVLDDCGMSVSQVNPFLALPIEITYAVIPFLPESAQVAEAVHRFGKEVIIHQPMEPVGNQNPGSGAIFTSDAKDVILNKLQLSCENVPYAVGMNNHMGSKATADVRVMGEVLAFLGKRGFFFFDSKTSGGVVGKEIAASLQVHYLQRNAMFLDNEKNEEAIRKALQSGLKTADREGYAVMIGHALTNELAAVLLETVPEILEEGYEFNRLSDYFLGDFDQ